MEGCIPQMHFLWRQRRAVHAPKASPLGANYSALANNERGAVFSAASVALMVAA
jgi:hypothetical protein